MTFSLSTLCYALGLASLGLSAVLGNGMKREDASTMQLTPACNLYYQVKDGDTCWDIVSQNDNTFTMGQLLCWNPDINPGCSNLIPGRDVCVGVGRPVICQA